MIPHIPLPQHEPQADGSPEHDGICGLWPVLAVAENTDSFFINCSEPHDGHVVPFQFDDATRISESVPHFLQ